MRILFNGQIPAVGFTMDRLDPGRVWAQGPFGPRARLGPGPPWAQGCLGPGPVWGQGPFGWEGQVGVCRELADFRPDLKHDMNAAFGNEALRNNGSGQ